MATRTVPKPQAEAKLREIGRRDLGLLSEILFDLEFWSLQQTVLSALSDTNATVAEPSAHAVGKTLPAAAAALSFYWTYPDSKVITISSNWKQMQKVLWGDIRTLAGRSSIPLGVRVLQGDMEAQDVSGNPNAPRHYMMGMSPQRQENIQGHHAAHVLIIADEATTIDAQIAEGIRSLRSSGDARLLLIFNPTTTKTWAYEECKKPRTRVFPVAAWDTPNFCHLTREEIEDRYGSRRSEEYWGNRLVRVESEPKGAALIGDWYLRDLLDSSKGPGSMTWENKVEGRFVEGRAEQLIHPSWIARAKTDVERMPGTRIFGVDLAAQAAENVIAYRDGNTLVGCQPYPAMNPKVWWVIVGRQAEGWHPQWVVFDSSGIGGGSWESAEKAVGEARLVPVRGEMDMPGGIYANLRSAYWWEFAEGLREGRVAIAVEDKEMEEQLCAMTYSVTDRGAIKMQSKNTLYDEGTRRLDRADAVVLAFGFDPPQMRAVRKVDEDEEDAELAEREEDEEADWLDFDVHPVLGTDDY